MLSGHADGLLDVVDVGGLSLGVLSLVTIDETLRLVDENGITGLWFVLTGDSEGGMEVTDVLVHTDGFLGLAGLDELTLCLLVTLLVLQLEGKLQVNVADLMFGVQICHLEGLLELSLV
jgi:hypothetical protein